MHLILPCLNHYILKIYKSLFISLLLILIISFPSKTQSYWGVKGELQRLQVGFSPFLNQILESQYGIGLVFKHLQTKDLGIQIELNYIQKSFNLINIDSAMAFDFIELPIYCHWIFLYRKRYDLFINIGSFIGYAFQATLSQGGLTRNFELRPALDLVWQHGITVNGGLNLKTSLGHFQFSAGFIYHWTNLENPKFDQTGRSSKFGGFTSQLIYFLPKKNK